MRYTAEEYPKGSDKWVVRDTHTGRIVFSSKTRNAKILAENAAAELSDEEEYENDLLTYKNSQTKKSKQETQGGNIFAALFGAVVVVGILAAASNTLIRGPIATVVAVQKSTKATANMDLNAALALREAAGAPDCDSDGLNEPMVPVAGVGPSGGGTLPAVAGASYMDPWGTPYGYCAWDHGTQDTGLCGSLLTGQTPAGAVLIAMVSAGPDRVFQSTCGAAPDYLTQNGDDLAEVYSPAQAGTMTGGDGIWKLDPVDDTKATTEKELALDAAVTFSSNSSMSISAGAVLDMAGLFFLPDQTELGVCNAANTGALRRQSAPGAENIEICDGTAWVSVGVRVLDELVDVKTDYTGSYSMFLGENVGAGTTGDYNTAVGAGAFSGVGDGNGNAVYGAFAGGHTSGDYNTFIGYQAGDASTGNNNTYLGKAAGYGNMAGYANTFTGYHSGYGGGSFGDGFGNAGYGYGSLFHLTYGNYNTALGWNAGSTLTTGSYNIYIGNNVAAGAGGENYKLNIGNLITGDLSAKMATVEGTAALKIPSGTTAQRPTPSAGMVRFNTSANAFEGYNGTVWGSLAANPSVSFLSLTDTPSAYTGHAGKTVKVNAAATGLEFVTVTAPATTFLALTDTPAAYTGQGGKFVAVKSDASGLEFVAAPSGGGGGGGAPAEYIVAIDNSGGAYSYTVLVDTIGLNNGFTAPGVFCCMMLGFQIFPAAGNYFVEIVGGGSVTTYDQSSNVYAALSGSGVKAAVVAFNGALPGIAVTPQSGVRALLKVRKL